MRATDNKNAVAANQEMTKTADPALCQTERNSLSLSRLEEEPVLETSPCNSSSHRSSSLYQGLPNSTTSWLEVEKFHQDESSLYHASQNSTTNWLEVEKFYQDEFDSTIHGPFHDIYKKETEKNDDDYDLRPVNTNRIGVPNDNAGDKHKRATKNLHQPMTTSQ